MKTALLLSLLFIASASHAMRQVTNIDSWLFSRDSLTWEEVKVPHDWAINGPFDKKWDLQVVAIEQNGEKEKTEKSGRSGSLPWIGRGFYRTHFRLEGPRQTWLYFDGAMAEPRVYVNGKLAGEWKYGYNAFRLNITPYVREGDNELTVTLNNLEESSRWYPGAGLYRPVRLVMVSDINIDPWQLFVHTVSADSAHAVLSIDASLTDGVAGGGGALAIELILQDSRGHTIAANHHDISPEKAAVVGSPLTIKQSPKLWSPETPYLYKIVARLYQDNTLIDEYSTKIGIRTISIDSVHGFRLNGKERKFKGVCLHHDEGPFGAAESKEAFIRQIRLMKDMGADALRTSHNMPSRMQMDVCDSLGMMVMAESFDNWKQPKVKNGYGRYYDEWWKRDLENLIVSNRNHPSIVMWSIGNEIPEQGNKKGAAEARAMTDYCHSLDPTRMVTCGADRPEADVRSGFYNAVDIPGFNYRDHLYKKVLPQLRQGFLLGSETASTVSSRGVYKFPVRISNSTTYPDGQCSGYDTEYCSWSNLPDDDFFLQDSMARVIGQFVWTGIDYLGEPTPYDTYWPSRSSYFGAVDLAGLPKDRFYLYRSVWNTGSHTIHLLPHWTWKGREGEITPVFCYTDYPEGELFINGVSQGRKRKETAGADGLRTALGVSLSRRRLIWQDVRYEPGELKVVVYDDHGVEAGSEVIRTAGKASLIRLKNDRYGSLSFVTITVTDADGNICPTADNMMTMSVSGEGRLRCACNGDATSTVSFNSPSMPLFSGALVAVVETDNGGTSTLHVTSKGFPEATLDITAR